MARHLFPLSAMAATLCAAIGAAQAGFPTYTDMINDMSAAAANFPGICQLVNLNTRYGTPATHNGQDLYVLKISDNVASEEDEPSFLMVSAHHGNEYGTPLCALYAINQLTTGYGNDPQITAIVDSNEIWIAPCWNPDGYPTSRRNANPNGTIDLNRNYPFLWDSPCNTGVRGASAGSEPETQTMIAFSEDQRFTKVLDYHSSGRETLWGYRQTCSNHVFASYFEAEAILISTASSYGGRVRGPSSNGEHYQYQMGEFSNYAFLTEISNTQSPTRASADQEAMDVWPGTIFMLERPIPVQGHVTDAASGQPVVANISYVENPFTDGERNRSEPSFGRYHAFLPNGSHTLRFEAPGYQSQDVPVNVTPSGLVVDVALVPPGISFNFPSGIPTSVEPGGGTTVRVEVVGGLRTPQPGTGMLQVSSANGSRSFAMTQVSPNVYDAVLPGFQCGDNVMFSFSVEDSTGQLWNSPPTGSYQAPTATLVSVVATVDFETASGWAGSAPGDTAIRGLWERADPEATNAQPEDDHTPGAGSLCWVTDGRAGTGIGSFDVDGGFTTLVSSVYDVSSEPEAAISYWRWFSNDEGSSPSADVLVVDISNDGGANWVNVETVGPTGSEASGGWFQHSFRIADFVTPTAQIQMRFIAEDAGAGSIVEAAIDDFQIGRTVCDGEVVRAGAGCPDATGSTLEIVQSGSVHLGSTLDLEVRSGSAVSYVLLSGTAVLVPAVSIPGTGSCFLYLQNDFALGPIAFGASTSLLLPNDPALIGASLLWQGAVADPALATPLKAATSDYLTTTFGS